MPLNQQLSFRTPPRSIHLSGHSPAVYTAEDVSKARREGYAEGEADTTRALEGKISQLRDEIALIQNAALGAISEKFQSALSQMRTLLPQLVVEATARVIGGIQINSTIVKSVVEDLLSEVAPGADQLEVQLCESDLQKMEQFQHLFRQKFPAIDFRVNPELNSGDCMVKTRFGVLDGRIVTKIRGIEALLS